MRSLMKRRFSSGTSSRGVALKSTVVAVAEKTMSTPYGWPSTWSSIHFNSCSRCSGVIQAAPRTPKPPALDVAATTSLQWLKAKIGASIPSNSVAAVFIEGLEPLLGGEMAFEALAGAAMRNPKEHTDGYFISSD